MKFYYLEKTKEDLRARKFSLSYSFQDLIDRIENLSKKQRHLSHYVTLTRSAWVLFFSSFRDYWKWK